MPSPWSKADDPDIRDPAPSKAPWRVLCEISMPSAEMANTMLETGLADAFEKGLISDAKIAASGQQAADFWKIRETIPLSKRAYKTAVNHDISVPVSRIPAFLAACAKAVHTIAPDAELLAFGHVGDGNLHYSACEPTDTDTPIIGQLTDEITGAVYETTMAHGGSISAEHGVGQLKRDALVSLRPPAATHAMLAIKKALDPKNIMNPGRVVDTSSL